MIIMQFSEFMQKKRIASGLSLYRLSKRTGITAQQLSNYEQKLSNPSLEKADMICKALGCTFEIGGEQDGCNQGYRDL
jgi:transcriptional regulator with XRE-family HTH domain